MVCATQFSQGYCKYFVGKTVDQIEGEIFNLMLSQNMVCGYLFDLCTTNYYKQNTTAEWLTRINATKPADASTNDFLDKLYDTNNMTTNPPLFKILWMSDLDIDINYVVDSSVNCYDYSCCHETRMAATEDEKAPKYGHKKCNMPMDTFKKLVDTLNTYNGTNYLSWNSLLYGGSTNAYAPEFLTEAQTLTVHQEVFKYLREKNPILGLYYAVGPHDLFPLNF